MHQRAQHRLALTNELRTAIDSGQLRLRYQPQVATKSGQLLGVEALVRWQHPTRGLLPPAEFISLAEETQLIVDLGGWVIRESCRQAAAWERLRPAAPPLRMCVNVSVRQLGRPELLTDVASALGDNGLDPTQLCLEITESVLMADADFFMEGLRQLRQLGVAISIDDFGTGYSSLAYLQRFPIDAIKIDKGFVEDLAKEDLRSRAVVAAVIDPAHALELYAVAEGVETREQLEVLQQLGCDVAQGYYLARPLAERAVRALIMSSNDTSAT